MFKVDLLQKKYKGKITNCEFIDYHFIKSKNKHLYVNIKLETQGSKQINILYLP